MKNIKTVLNLTLMALLCFAITFSGCTIDDTVSPGNNPNEDPDNGNFDNVQFLAYYKPGNDKALGSDKSIQLITVKDGTLTYSTFLNAYPEDNMTTDCDINNNVMVLGLNAKDFDNKGAFMMLNGESAYYLPLIEPAPESNDYAYFQPSTGDVSDNGMIIYSSATNDISYGDQYQPYLLRYNPKDDTYQVASDPTGFAKDQPELGTDTEKGQIGRTLFASPDGRYAYGQVDAFGVDGGSYHWDYEILFKYDFDNDQYTRLGQPDDNDVSISAMTSDRRYILYSNRGTTKLLDLETGNVSTTDMNIINVKKNSWGKNGCCVGASTGDLYYKDFVNNKDILVCKTGYGWAYNAMFSNDESKIYFCKEGSGVNYLMVTSGVTEGSTYDTIGSFPAEIYDMVMIK